MGSGGFDVRVAVPDDAAAVRSVQAQTWLATYPNPELGITREGLRRYLEGEDGERIAERIARARQRLVAQAGDPAGGCTFVAVLDSEIVSFTAPFAEPGGRRRVGALYVRPSAQGFVVTGPAVAPRDAPVARSWWIRVMRLIRCTVGPPINHETRIHRANVKADRTGERIRVGDGK